MSRQSLHHDEPGACVGESTATGRRADLSLAVSTAVILALLVAGGCEGGMGRVDRRVDRLLAETSGDLGGNPAWPALSGLRRDAGGDLRGGDPAVERPTTTNPDAAALRYVPADEGRDVNERLRSYAELAGEGPEMDLRAALAFAIAHSREYRFAEEEYVLAALRLLIERHRWGPRFFDEVRAEARASGDNGLYDSSLSLVNEFRITQRLPHGGEIAARALARATEDLHQFVSGERVQDAELILTADIPLLRGAGLAAREDRIQAERSMIYAARAFESFRREFLFDISQDYLDLVVQQQAIANAERQVKRFEELEVRQEALRNREPVFQIDLAAQDTLFARDRLNSQRESHRLALDRFKIRLGMPTEEPLRIVAVMPNLPPPDIGVEEAVALAMQYRLDLQSRRDQVDDARRQVLIARNNLLGDLDVSAQASLPTDDSRGRAGLDFEPQDSELRAAVTFGLPLDREIERLGLRDSEIALERAVREYTRFRDTVALEVRAAVREIDRALFSLQIQVDNVAIAERRQESIDAAPGRADARDRSEAATNLLRARDDLDRARRDLQVAILGYLVSSGQLRVQGDGQIMPLPGMQPQDEPPGAGNEQPAADG
jgi:outer membrane protein TolC